MPRRPTGEAPQDKDQYNFTDPESRIAPGADGIVQGYNAQAAVELTLLLIVGQTVTEASNDKRQLKPMVELIEQQSGQRPQALPCRQRILFGGEPEVRLVDKPEHKIEGFIATGKQKHGEHRLPAKRGPPCRGRDGGRSNEAVLQTKVGKAVYAARKCVVEPVFGQIKQGSRISSIPVTWKRESERRVGTAVHGAQHFATPRGTAVLLIAIGE